MWEALYMIAKGDDCNLGQAEMGVGGLSHQEARTGIDIFIMYFWVKMLNMNVNVECNI